LAFRTVEPYMVKFKLRLMRLVRPSTPGLGACRLLLPDGAQVEQVMVKYAATLMCQAEQHLSTWAATTDADRVPVCPAEPAQLLALLKLCSTQASLAKLKTQWPASAMSPVGGEVQAAMETAVSASIGEALLFSVAACVVGTKASSLQGVSTQSAKSCERVRDALKLSPPPLGWPSNRKTADWLTALGTAAAASFGPACAELVRCKADGTIFIADEEFLALEEERQRTGECE
jgi:hypothetical protein